MSLESTSYFPPSLVSTSQHTIDSIDRVSETSSPVDGTSTFGQHQQHAITSSAATTTTLQPKAASNTLQASSSQSQPLSTIRHRSVTKESLLPSSFEDYHNNHHHHHAATHNSLAHEIDAEYRITPPPSPPCRQSPLLFAASFHQLRQDQHQQHSSIVSPTISSVNMNQHQSAVIDGVVSSKQSTTAAKHPPSIIHNPPSVVVSRGMKHSSHNAPHTVTSTHPSATNSNHQQQPSSPTSENTGRWTAEEHRLFLQGLEEHGKGWKKIASLIQTRTVVQIRTHAQKYFQKLAKARANGDVGDGDDKLKGGVGIGGVGIGGGVSMRTVSHNMSLGNDSISLAAANGAVGTGGNHGRKRRNSSGGNGTKRKAIGSVVRSSVREGRNWKRQKKLLLENNDNCNGEEEEMMMIENPLPAISHLLDPYVMAPPQSIMGQQPQPQGEEENNSWGEQHSGGNNTNGNTTKKVRGRQQLVQTATHGVLPMAALEDAVFRLLTPAPGATTQTANASSQHQQPPTHQSIVDPLAPKISAPTNYNQGSSILPPSSSANGPSPTGVADMSVFPSWVDAKNPPTWYNNGEDIDKLLEDADDLNWLVDTGDLDETFPPALEAMQNHHHHDANHDAVKSDDALDLLEPTPLVVGDAYDYTVSEEQGSVDDVQEDEEPDEEGTVAVDGTSTAATSSPNLVTSNPTTNHPSVESLSFLVDSPKTGELKLPPVSFPEESSTGGDDMAAATSASVLPTHHSAMEIIGEESQNNLMNFPDLDMGDEHAFVSALLDTGNKGSREMSALSFSKWGSQNGVAELENDE